MAPIKTPTTNTSRAQRVAANDQRKAAATAAAAAAAVEDEEIICMGDFPAREGWDCMITKVVRPPVYVVPDDSDKEEEEEEEMEDDEEDDYTDVYSNTSFSDYECVCEGLCTCNYDVE